jgi:hypothetical protein
LKGEAASQFSKRTLAYDTGFTLAPGTYTLKFLARENETGKMGTFETKFTIPDLTTELKYPADQRGAEQPAAGNEMRPSPRPRRTRRLLTSEPAGAGQS